MKGVRKFKLHFDFMFKGLIVEISQRKKMSRYVVDFYSIDFDILKIDIFFSKAKLEMTVVNVKQIL